MNRVEFRLRIGLTCMALMSFACYVAVGLIDDAPVVLMPAVIGVLYALASLLEIIATRILTDRLALRLATASARGDYAEAELARLRRLRTGDTAPPPTEVR